MRTIKFRGIDIETGQWINGDLIQYKGYLPNIHFSYMSNGKLRYGQRVVKKETVGQFIELYDKHDDEIYEDDIIVWTIYHADSDGLGVLKKDIKYKGVVKWHQGGFVLKDMDGDGYYSISDLSSNLDFEIIGNIHDKVIFP